MVPHPRFAAKPVQARPQLQSTHLASEALSRSPMPSRSAGMTDSLWSYLRSLRPAASRRLACPSGPPTNRQASAPVAAWAVAVRPAAGAAFWAAQACIAQTPCANRRGP